MISPIILATMLVANVIGFIFFMTYLLGQDIHPFKWFQILWMSRNIFGKICAILFMIIELPAIIIIYCSIGFIKLVALINYYGTKKRYRFEQATTKKETQPLEDGDSEAEEV